MDNDDRPVGRILTRREALVLLGASGYAMLGRYAPLSGQAGSTPAPCVVRPAQTEGPYFVDELLHRADVRSDPSDGSVRPGTPLALTLVVSRLAGNACQPMSGVHVDIWQCDHEGIYSDVQDPSFNTKGKKFLRGYQLTDGEGKATFQTIYPGWYRGRTVHIHFKLRTTPRAASGHEFTSQLYFDDALTDRVFQAAPYSARGARSTRNNADGIFRQNGSQLLVDVSPSGKGYAGTFQVAFQGV